MFQIFGSVAPPPGAAAYGGSVFGGLVPFLNNILRLIFVISGLFAFFNLILGGFGFLSAGGDAKAIEKAWNKIWQSLIGLILIISSFILAAIFGYLLLGDPTGILNPKLYGPSQIVTSNANLTAWLNCVKINGVAGCLPQQAQAFKPGASIPPACIPCLNGLSSGATTVSSCISLCQ